MNPAPVSVLRRCRRTARWRVPTSAQACAPRVYSTVLVLGSARASRDGGSPSASATLRPSLALVFLKLGLVDIRLIAVDDVGLAERDLDRLDLLTVVLDHLCVTEERLLLLPG